MIKVYVDAATNGNPGLSGGGFVLSGDGYSYEQLSFPLPELTNHQAEFAAFLAALDYLLEKNMETETIMIYTDSKVLAQTIDKNYTSNPAFQDYLHDIQLLLPKFTLLIVQWIPEKQNKGADNLARQGLARAKKLQDRRKQS